MGLRGRKGHPIGAIGGCPIGDGVKVPIEECPGGYRGSPYRRRSSVGVGSIGEWRRGGIYRGEEL